MAKSKKPKGSKKQKAGEKSKKKKFSFYHIGEITESRKGLQLKTENGRLKKIAGKGYNHFQPARTS